MSINVPQKRIENLTSQLNGKQNKLVAGANITIDNTDPNNPVISAGLLAVSSFTVTDWNNYNSNTTYSFVDTTPETLNGPITPDNYRWFVQYCFYENNKAVIAIRVDDPSNQWIRCCNNGAWTAWTLGYAVYK